MIKNKNRLLSFIFAIGIGLLSIFSFLVPQENDVVYADNFVTPEASFIGSNIDTLIRFETGSIHFNMSFSVDFVPNTLETPNFVSKINCYDINSSGIRLEAPLIDMLGSFFVSEISEDGLYYSEVNYDYIYRYSESDNTLTGSGRFYYFMSEIRNYDALEGTTIDYSNFNGVDIYKISIGNNVVNSFDLPDIFYSGNKCYYNYIGYTNLFNQTFYFCFPILYGSSFPSDTSSVHYKRLLNERVYYLESALNENNPIAYEKGYQNGFSTGKAEGNKIGYNNGYNVGFNEGVVSANDYSFLGFFGAIFDAPINAFNNLFSFELFGVNMRTLILGLLTICIVILLVRFLIGGKS